MQHIIDDHEAVREFVQRETGGYVEKIESESKSTYRPTLDSQIEQLVGGFCTRYGIIPNPEFLPERYEASYRVRVTFPPGSRYMECAVYRTGDDLRLIKRVEGFRW